MLISEIDISTYATSISVNTTLFYELLLNYCKISFGTYSLVLVSISNSVFCCLQVLHLFCFSSFLLLCRIQHCSLICTMLFHLRLHFFLFLFFCVCWIYQTVSTIVIHWILIRSVSFLVLILVSSKVPNFHNEAHTFLYQKS